MIKTNKVRASELIVEVKNIVVHAMRKRILFVSLFYSYSVVCPQFKPDPSEILFNRQTETIIQYIYFNNHN